METVSFTTGEDAAEFFLICTREVEAGYICSGIHLSLAESHELRVLRNGLIYCLFRIDALMLLIYICNLYSLTDSDLT